MFSFIKYFTEYRLLGWLVLLTMFGPVVVASDATAGNIKIGFVDIQKAITETKEFVEVR